jgi:hypothetical protein
MKAAATAYFFTVFPLLFGFRKRTITHAALQPDEQ